MSTFQWVGLSMLAFIFVILYGGLFIAIWLEDSFWYALGTFAVLFAVLAFVFTGCFLLAGWRPF